MAFGEYLRREREAAGLTQAELAERASLTVSAIGALERGERRHPYPHTVRALATALGLKASQRETFLLSAARPPSGDANRPREPASSRIPSYLSPLIGREAEVEVAVRLLQRPETRLLTLTGPGGVGKTRLAIQAATQAADDFVDGVIYVSLAPLRDPALVVSTIAYAVGESAVDRRSPLDNLTATLRDRRSLLVLDNFEHLLAAAPQVTALLLACPDLKVLVTSRARLRVGGEQEYRVPPLELPSVTHAVTAEEAVQAPAVALFIARAQAADPTFELTADNVETVNLICRRLDALPLAIELAAARVATLPLATLLARSGQSLQILTGGARDAPERQQNLRDTIGWSYDLLTPEEQALFRQLAVFAGGCTLEAVEAVAGSDFEGAVLDRLATLVDKSLVQYEPNAPGGPRYGLLETIREFAWEQLTASGESAEMQRRHADWCLQLAEDVAAGDPSSYPAMATGQRLARDHDNLRVALTWWEAQGPSAEALRFITLLEPLWRQAGFSREGDRWLTWGIAGSDGLPDAVVVPALGLAAQVTQDLGDGDRAWSLAEAALARAPATGTARASALVALGAIARWQNDAATARACCEEALTLARASGDRATIVKTLCHLATLGDLGSVVQPGNPADQARAVAYCEEALRLCEEAGDDVWRARALNGMAVLAYKARDYSRAAGLARKTLDAWWRMDEYFSLPSGLEDLADIAGMTGRPRAAARLYGAAEALRERLENPIPPFYLDEYERELAVSRAALGQAAFTAAWEEGRALPLEAAVVEAFAVADDVMDARQVREGPASASGLTSRECEVLTLLVAGHSHREIGEALFLSKRTVESHVARIYEKLGVRTRAGAISLALATGLATLPPQDKC